MNYNNHLIGICRVAPLPKVAKSIRREIEANRLTASDIRFRSLAANMAIERPRRRVGLNDGVFYPEEFVPEGLMRMAARRPTHLCAWSKAHLGWLKPKNITIVQTQLFNPKTALGQ